MSLFTETQHGFKGLKDCTIHFYTIFQDSIRKQREYNKTVRELESLSERELNDLGLSYASIRQTAYNIIYNKETL